MRYLILLTILVLTGCNYSKKKENLTMKKSIFKLADIIKYSPECKIFEIIDNNSDNPMEWRFIPTTLQLIPTGQGHYLTKAYRIEKNGLYKPAYINVSTPERIVDFVIYNLNKPVYSYAYDSRSIEVIPAIASDCFGSYELYYSRFNTELSIKILKQGLEISKEKNVIAEDLGYILRDESRHEEALNYYLISEQYGASSEFIIAEIENIYRLLGNIKKAEYYKLKLKNYSL